VQFPPATETRWTPYGEPEAIEQAVRAFGLEDPMLRPTSQDVRACESVTSCRGVDKAPYLTS